MCTYVCVCVACLYTLTIYYKNLICLNSLSSIFLTHNTWTPNERRFSTIAINRRERDRISSAMGRDSHRFIKFFLFLSLSLCFLFYIMFYQNAMPKALKFVDKRPRARALARNIGRREIGVLVKSVGSFDGARRINNSEPRSPSYTSSPLLQA